MKWNFPHFQYKGMLCSMASFNAHCAFGFWKGELLVAAEDDKGKEAMGQFGRITSVKDLPAKRTLVSYIRKAMKLNDDGVKAPARTKPATSAALREVAVPDYFIAQLAQLPAALEHFTAFSASKKRDYVEWLEEAKTEATRQRRMAQALEWIAEGKSRNWKYEKC
jgi:uncharacterized protein YdeI (YjbR/CyaY-like superfamily)